MCIMLHYLLWTIIFHSIKLICDFMICYTCCISDNVTWGIVRLTYINLKKIINWIKMLKLIYTYLKKKNRKYLHIILLSLALYSSQENSFCKTILQFSVSFAGESCFVLTCWFTFRCFSSRRDFQNERGTQSKHNICMSSIFTGEMSFDLSLLWKNSGKNICLAMLGTIRSDIWILGEIKHFKDSPNGHQHWILGHPGCFGRLNWGLINKT